MKSQIQRLTRGPIGWALAGVAAAGFLLSCGSALAQSAINNVYPNGQYQFQYTNALVFTATSSAGIGPANITVILTETALTGQTTLKVLSGQNGLTLTGSSTSWTVSAPVFTNVLVSAAISVTDSNSSSASTSVSFDTISPAYTFEAEDFDYNSGSWIPNPQTNAYANLTGTPGVDCNHPGNAGQDAYRPNPLETEGVTDTPRLTHPLQDYDVGFNNGGDWGNYTRNYPAGTYNIYMRGADGNGQVADSASIAVQAGTGVLNGAGKPQFSVPNKGGWNGYNWVPLLDTNNNLVTFVSDGSVTTLRVNTDNGNYNANFYMLLPTNTSPIVAGSASITSPYPDGAHQFEPSPTFTFNAVSSVGLNASGVVIVMGATNLLGQGSSALLTSSSGLTVGGTSNSRSVSTPLSADTVYHAQIVLTDLNGNSTVTNLIFDTISPNYYTFESRDFDYSGGQFFDNPQTNAYSVYSGENQVDYNCPNPPANNPYAYGRVGLATEGCGDIARVAYTPFTLFPDYDVGSVNTGDWGNYTRHFPSGTYNIFMRAADGNGPNTDSANMSLVTAGFGTTSQTTTPLGTFGVPGTGGWQVYTWVPLKSAGNLVQHTFNGSTNTLRVTTDSGSYNTHFYMLVPVNNSLPSISGLYPDGLTLFQYTNRLSFVASSAAGIATSQIVVTLDGTNQVGNLSFSGSSTSWSVGCPIAPNQPHTVSISVTDNNSNVASAALYSFDTFSTSYYTWEAEDFDYTSNSVSGLFFDNPQVDAYNQLPVTSGIDCVEADGGASSFAYRPSPAVSTSIAGDKTRAQFANHTDYNIGFFGAGSWCNYTRHYPAGTYYVWGRFAEGAGLCTPTLSQLTSGYATSTQTSNVLGTFFVPNNGWSTWQWTPMTDSNSNLLSVTLSGSAAQTLKLEGLGNNEVNVNFLMLVPTGAAAPVTATITRNGSSVSVSFPTALGSSYQVVYKNHLTDATWTPVGGSVIGDGTTHSVSDTIINGATRFYRVQTQ